MKKIQIEDSTGMPHRCLEQTHKDEGVYIKNSSHKGIPCYNKCGKFIVLDNTLPEIIRLNPTTNRPMKPEPKLREVVTKLDIHGKKHYDVDTGAHHTRYRCMMLKDGYSDQQVIKMEYSFWIKHEWYLEGLRQLFKPPKANVDAMVKELLEKGIIKQEDLEESEIKQEDLDKLG